MKFRFEACGGQMAGSIQEYSQEWLCNPEKRAEMKAGSARSTEPARGGREGRELLSSLFGNLNDLLREPEVESDGDDVRARGRDRLAARVVFTNGCGDAVRRT